MHVPTLVMDLHWESPPIDPVSLGARTGVRALVWRAERPLGEIHLRGVDTVAAQDLLDAAHAQFGASADPPHLQRESMTLPSVTVAICTRDRPEDLRACLASLQRQDGGVDHEILVVDNAPSDERARAVTLQAAGVRYVMEPMPGLTFARNRALREARGDVLAFVDDDARPAHGWLRSGARSFAQMPAIAACCGPMLPAELETEAQELFELRGGFTQGFERAVYGPEAPNQAHRQHWPCLAGVYASANMAFRVPVLRELGGFDEAMGPGTATAGGDDHDVFYRLLRSGRSFLYEPSFLVRHRHRLDLPALREQLESWGRGTTAFLVKCWSTDPSRRRAARRAIRWLFVYQLRRAAKAIFARDPAGFPASLALVELAGCLRGLTAYRAALRANSRLRVERAGRATFERGVP
jgi:glycosyltransferase involved in cell wall biosynthesis